MTSRPSRFATLLGAAVFSFFALSASPAQAFCELEIDGASITAHGNKVQIGDQLYRVGTPLNRDAFMSQLERCGYSDAASHFAAWRRRIGTARGISVASLFTPFWPVTFPAMNVVALIVRAEAPRERNAMVDALQEASYAEAESDE